MMQLPGNHVAGSIPPIITRANIANASALTSTAATASTTRHGLNSMLEQSPHSGVGVGVVSGVVDGIGGFESNSTMTTTTTPMITAGVGFGVQVGAGTTRMPSNQSFQATVATAVGLNATLLDPLDVSSGGVGGGGNASSSSLSNSNTWNSSFATATANSYNNCSALFANYTQPQTGIYCNWTWDSLLCWPPTPAGVLARMNCPAGYHGVDTRKFANRKCELDGNWGNRPNGSEPNPGGWTDYGPCYKPEVIRLMQEIKDVGLYMEIAQRTRTLEIIGLCISLFALIISLIIFCAFRSLRNNRTKIHKNLFIAMVLQVIVRLTLYLDQFRRGKPEATANTSQSVIENTPYLCEASYVLLEYARTAMFMWMFIEGLYLHNMITVAVFQGNFPIMFFSLLGWGMPVLMTFVWVQCTAVFMDTSLGDCMWNYNLTPYYWILEGPRLAVILLNFFFLVNIIRVLVVKLRQSQASDIEQTRKAVRAAIVLLPLLGITNLLHLVPALKTAWKFAIWSYVTHFLTSFQGFFIALIYCFLNGEVRAVLLKSLAVWMSVRGHSDWVPKRASMYSGAYNTAPDTDAPPGETGKRVSPPNKRLNSRKANNVTIVIANEPQRRKQQQQQQQQQEPKQQRNNNNTGNRANDQQKDEPPTVRIRSKESSGGRSNWMLDLCFRGQKVLRVPPTSSVPPESVVFELSEQ